MDELAQASEMFESMLGRLWFEEFRKGLMTGRQWTREEDLAVLYLRNRGMSPSDPAITELAEATERSGSHMDA